jgi:hypothetical protein
MKELPRSRLRLGVWEIILLYYKSANMRKCLGHAMLYSVGTGGIRAR